MEVLRFGTPSGDYVIFTRTIFCRVVKLGPSSYGNYHLEVLL